MVVGADVVAADVVADGGCCCIADTRRAGTNVSSRTAKIKEKNYK